VALGEALGPGGRRRDRVAVAAVVQLGEARGAAVVLELAAGRVQACATGPVAAAIEVGRGEVVQLGAAVAAQGELRGRRSSLSAGTLDSRSSPGKVRRWRSSPCSSGTAIVAVT
jgi:hypothetical protein